MGARSWLRDNILWRFTPSPPDDPRIVDYWSYDRDAPISCVCGWRGIARDREEYYHDLLDVTCPECWEMLLIVQFPTGDQTRVAAAAGNERAILELPSVTLHENRIRRVEASHLTASSALPELPGQELHLEWDIAEIDGDQWTIISHEGTEIWRELAYYEGYERFAEVVRLLRKRYGKRLRELRPTKASELYLYGDASIATYTVANLNAELANPSSVWRRSFRRDR